MATFTVNYNLRKPDGVDFVDEATQLNANWDIIDTTLKNFSDLSTSITASITNLESEWTAWTPNWGNLTLGNGATKGRYKRVGKTVHFVAELSFGGTTALQAGQLNIKLPVNAQYSIDLGPTVAYGRYSWTIGGIGHRNVIAVLGYAASGSSDHAFIYMDGGPIDNTATNNSDTELILAGTYEANDA